MAAKQAVSFDEIIQAGRQKKKNEELANKLLVGKNRRASAPGSGIGNKAQIAAPGSLASRIGVTKRSASATVKSKQNQTTSAPGRGKRSVPTNKRRPNEKRLIAALNPASGQATVRNNGVGITIKGASSGSFVVVGSNFAPGTTAADIQSALEPVSGTMLSCWVTAAHPTVTAEMEFAEKWAADKVIANFHNQKADGRVLSMRLKPAGTAPTPTGPSAFSKYPSIHSPFDGLREQADRERRQNRRADPEIQDGSYGFSEHNNQALPRDDRRGNGRYNNRRSNGRASAAPPRNGRNPRSEEQDSGLYSDQMMVDAPPQDSHNRNRRHR